MGERLISMIAAIFLSGLSSAFAGTDEKLGDWSYLREGEPPSAHVVVANCRADVSYPDRVFCFSFVCHGEVGAEFGMTMQRDKFPSSVKVTLLLDGREFPLSPDGDLGFRDIGDGTAFYDVLITYPEYKAFVRALHGSEVLGIPLGPIFGENNTQEFATAGLGELMVKAMFDCFVPGGLADE